jgi:hypothetical protein
MLDASHQTIERRDAEMKGKTIFFITVILLAAVALAGAQTSGTLTTTTALPKVDGAIGAKEYTLTTEALGMQLGLSLSADTLFVALSCPTTGWVSVGIGSIHMDGAVMYIGFVGSDKGQLKVQQGSGHRHSDTDANAPVQYSLSESNGRTMLELALKASSFIAKGQKTLDFIVAMGSADSFVSLHKARAGLSISLAQ